MLLRYFAPIFNLCLLFIWSGLFDSVYDFAPDTSKQAKNSSGKIWTSIMIFFMAACIWRCYEAWQLARERKITVIDVYFISTLNLLALVHFTSHFVVFRINLNYDKENELLSRRMVGLGEWSLLPFLGWSVVWSRHIRRGWNLKYNWMVCFVSVFSFLLTFTHRTSYYFILGVGSTLSCIALYETYKVHYYRTGVKPIFRFLLFVNVILPLEMFANYFAVDIGWSLDYFHVTAFALIAALTVRLYVIILKEVNEHKF